MNINGSDTVYQLPSTRKLAVLNSARKYIRNSKAGNTKRVYGIARDQFTSFANLKTFRPCLPRHLPTLVPNPQGP